MILRRSLPSFNVDSRRPLYVRRTSDPTVYCRDDHSRRKVQNVAVDSSAVLWDLAGQPDYRLIHALFLDDADLVLVLFDPTHDHEPLRGVEYWLRHIHGSGGFCCVAVEQVLRRVVGCDGTTKSTQGPDLSASAVRDLPAVRVPRSRVYLPLVTAPYYVFIGRKT
jgi:hypothetical protein